MPPNLEGMLETFLLLYGAVVIAGSWLMLNGIAEAPLGYEDEDGFHYVPVGTAAESGNPSEKR